jgi:hypothetical protein
MAADRSHPTSHISFGSRWPGFFGGVAGELAVDLLDQL